MHPPAPTVQTPATSTQVLVNQGVRPTQARCMACDAAMSGQHIFCPHCDGGPYHEGCVLHHFCPPGTGQNTPLFPPPFPPSGGGSNVWPNAEVEKEKEREVYEDDEEDDEWDKSLVSPSLPMAFANREAAESAFANRLSAPMGKGMRPRSMGGIPGTPMWPGQTQSKPPTVNLMGLPESPMRRPAQAPDEKGPEKKKFRPSEPLVKPYTRGSASKIDEAEKDDEKLRQIMAQFEEEKFASSNVAATKSKLKWWETRASRQKIDPYPLTRDSIDLAGALLKAGEYRSAAQYMATIKREHITRGHSWSDALQQAVTDAVRSCMRGMGPDKSCPSLDLRKLENLDNSQVKPVEGGPKNPLDVVVLFSLFACREIEAALRTKGQIKIEQATGCGVVSLFLPASKTDPKGAGVLRKQGCACNRSASLCPVAAAKRLLHLADAAGHKDDEPLLVTGLFRRWGQTNPSQVSHGSNLQGSGSGSRILREGSVWHHRPCATVHWSTIHGKAWRGILQDSVVLQMGKWDDPTVLERFPTRGIREMAERGCSRGIPPEGTGAASRGQCWVRHQGIRWRWSMESCGRSLECWNLRHHDSSYQQQGRDRADLGRSEDQEAGDGRQMGGRAVPKVPPKICDESPIEKDPRGPGCILQRVRLRLQELQRLRTLE